MTAILDRDVFTTGIREIKRFNNTRMADSQCAHISKVLPQVGELFTPYVINCVVMTFLSITAVAGNVLILVSICRAPQFVRQPSYFLLVNLAFADFCVGFLAEPAYLVYKISYLLDPFSALSCYAGITFNFLSYFLTSLSLWTAAAISLDRLLALHLHMKYKTIVTKFRVYFLIVILLMVSSVFASMFKWALDAQNTVFVCVDSLALLIALLSYVRIFQIVRYHQRQISTQLSEVSFGQTGGRNSTVGSASHGQQNGREQSKRYQEETVNTKREMQGKGRNLENIGISNEMKTNITTECSEKVILEERFSASNNMDGQPRIHQQMEMIGAKDQNQRKKGQTCFFGPSTAVDTTAGELVETKNTKPEITGLSGEGSTIENNYVDCKILNRETKRAEATAVEEKLQLEPRVHNLELACTITGTELLKINHNQQKKSITKLPRDTLALDDEQAASGFFCLERLVPIKLNVGYSVPDEKTADKQVKILPEETSMKKENCFKRMPPVCHQNRALVSENSKPALIEKKQRHEELTEKGCVERCYQNDELKSVLLHEGALVVSQETFRKEQAEADLSKDDSLNQTPNSNHASGEETAPPGIKQINSNSKNITPEIHDQKSTATLGEELDCGVTSHSQRPNSTKSTNTASRKGFKMRHFKKSVFNMFVIWFLMLLCYLPLICISTLVMLQGRSYSIHLAFNFTTSVMFVNSSINPIVFCWRIREFRAAVRKTLRDVFGFWQKQNNRLDNLSSLIN